MTDSSLLKSYQRVWTVHLQLGSSQMTKKKENPVFCYSPHFYKQSSIIFKWSCVAIPDVQIKKRKSQIIVVEACNGGFLDDAVHDVDLQGVQVWQDLIALWTGVFGNIPLMMPVSSWESETQIITWTCWTHNLN